MSELPLFLYRWVTEAELGNLFSGDHPIGDAQIGRDRSNLSLWVESGRYTIAPYGNTITVDEYLSRSMGVGGNAVGFFEYIDDHTKQWRMSHPSYNGLLETRTFFGRGRHLVIIPMGLYDGPPIYLSGAGLQDNIVACPEILKIAKLGTLMETVATYGQDAEWNMVPGQEIKLPAIALVFGSYDKENSFIPNAGLSDSMNHGMFLHAIQTLLTSLKKEEPASNIPQRVSRNINIGECPAAGGKRRKRKTRKQNYKKKRTHRNILPMVVGS